MFKEILNIIPKINSTDLNNMESQLGTRFQRIAKKFGKGLATVLASTAGAGIALTLIDKLLNPLKEVQDAIEKTLHSGETLADQARQFNSTAGELAKLHAFGQATGLDEGGVNVLLTKFQGAVTEAIEDPSKHSAVRNFTGEKNTVQAFLTFMENLQKVAKVDPQKAIAVQKEVFTERQTGKSSDFLGADFPALNRKFAKFDTTNLTKSVGVIDKYATKLNESQAELKLSDITGKANALTPKKGQPSLVDALAERAIIAQNRENERISNAKGLIELQNTADAFMATIESVALPKLGEAITQIKDVAKQLSDIKNLSFFKRFGFGGKDKKK